MGQYYRCLLLGKRYGNPRIMVSWDFGNAQKLTESSWVGNNYINAVLGVITNNPQRIAWVGDYSDERYGDVWENRLPDEKLRKFFSGCWVQKDGEKEFPRVKSCPRYEWTTGKDGYLVNYDKRIYIDLAENFERNTIADGWCMAPLSLLTAIGNNRGGGDYRDGNPDFDKVGTWAFDLIGLVQDKWEIPADCKEVKYGFKEEW